MSLELNVYTGTLTYKEIEFSFIFDGKELRLIPPKDKLHDVRIWFIKPLKGNAYTFDDSAYIEDSYLTGECNENLQKIIFPQKTQILAPIIQF